MSIQTELAIEVAALSDVGCHRANNEDSFGYDLQAQLFVVCDGMGGMAAGEIASRAAVDQLLLSYEDLCSSDMDIEMKLHQAIVNTNYAVWSAAQENEQLRGMGTTMVAVCIDGCRIVIANIGDSRAYFLRDGSCVQVTQDHSFAVEQMYNGTTPAPENKDHVSRQFITRAIGVEATVLPDLFTAEVQAGDRVLLATDGLTRYTGEEEIARHLDSEESLIDACRKLVNIAKDQGGSDNVTCLLLHFH